ncbi:MAG: hypothetical protein AAF483_20240 [Planctomycetota bacterium]
MPIESPCSGCGQQLSVSEEYAGRQARCPSCGQIYTVPHIESPRPKELYNTGTPAESSFTTPQGVPNPVPHSGAPESFWMKAADGNEYGPVDRNKLDSWFRDGRVGPGYQIKQGESGIWQPASVFQPQSTNPYATNSPSQGGGRFGTPVAGGYAKSDPSGLVLSMGIISWVINFIFCGIGWIPGLVAWISGRKALNDIAAGEADPTNLGLVQVGYYLGMVNVLLTLFGILVGAAIFAFALFSGGF